MKYKIIVLRVELIFIESLRYSSRIQNNLFLKIILGIETVIDYFIDQASIDLPFVVGHKLFHQQSPLFCKVCDV